MKKRNLFSLMLLIMAAAMLSFTSCNKDDDDDDNEDDVPEGVVGNWLSEGTNVAPLLAFYQINKITANFNEDGTYLVKSFTSTGTEVTYTGVYTQTKSSVGNIWTIRLEQSTPTAVTSEGIFEVTVVEGSARTMKYEVVQTQPSLGAAPPTPAGGFGSTTLVAPNSNIQLYVEVLP